MEVYKIDTIMKAVDYMENNQPEDALMLLEKYLPTADDDKKYTIAEFYFQWGFLQESLEILHELIRRYPDENELKILLANIFIELEEDSEAIQLLNEIDKNDPVYEQALLLLADLYQVQGLFEVSESKLLEAKQLNPNEPIIDFALGELYFSTGDYKKSIIHYEKVLLETEEISQISINERLAESYASSGEYEIALKYFQKEDSDNPDVLFKFGFTAYYADRKDIAINVWKKVIELDEHYHSVYYELAKAYYEEELLQEAFDTAEKGLKMDEYNKELYYFAGMLAYQLQKVSQSENYVRQAIVLDPDYKEALLFLINIFKQSDEQTKIVELLQDINELGAIDPLYDLELARAYNELEFYDKAAKSYQEAYHHLKDDSLFLKEYGYFLAEDGKLDEAIQVLEDYLQFEPSDVETIDQVDRFKQTKDN